MKYLIQNLPLTVLWTITEVNGYDDRWIKQRLTGVVDRCKITDVWKESGITNNYEYGILTNEIYQEWSGMKASEYKSYKGLRKESLRDNMTDIEVHKSLHKEQKFDIYVKIWYNKYSLSLENPSQDDTRRNNILMAIARRSVTYEKEFTDNHNYDDHYG